jgi:hypothetical protein
VCIYYNTYKIILNLYIIIIIIIIVMPRDMQKNYCFEGSQAFPARPSGKTLRSGNNTVMVRGLLELRCQVPNSQ